MGNHTIHVEHERNSSLAGTNQVWKKSRLTIGRRPDNQVIFDADEDRLVSGRHAEIFAENGSLFVRDLNSRNGITVNGAKTTRKELISGDEIAIGETVLAYVDEAAAAKPVTMTPEPEPGEIVVDDGVWFLSYVTSVD